MVGGCVDTVEEPHFQGILCHCRRTDDVDFVLLGMKSKRKVGKKRSGRMTRNICSHFTLFRICRRRRFIFLFTSAGLTVPTTFERAISECIDFPPSSHHQTRGQIVCPRQMKSSPDGWRWRRTFMAPVTSLWMFDRKDELRAVEIAFSFCFSFGQLARRRRNERKKKNSSFNFRPEGGEKKLTAYITCHKS